MTDKYLLSAIAVMSLVTVLLRFIPFLLLNGKRRTPAVITKLSSSLPYAIMGMLVVYCLKGTDFSQLSGCLPSIIATIVTGVLYIWKRNTLISIIVGTVTYMLLIQNL